MNVTIDMIAEKAHVSRGTVDRVLHNRGRVSPETAEKVHNALLELGYRGNSLGRAFSLSQKGIKIGVLASLREADFEAQVISGINDGIAYAEQHGFRILLCSTDADDERSCLDALNFFQKEGVSGIAMTGLPFAGVAEKLDELQAGGIQVVAFNNDMKERCRSCFVGQDHIKSGKCAAYLMKQICNQSGDILIIGVSREHLASMQRIRSFTEVLQVLSPDLSLKGPFYCAGNNELSSRVVLEQLKFSKQIQGIFAGGAGLSGVCQAVSSLNLTGKIKVIGFDTTQSNARFLKNGVVQFLIDQNPYQQGYRSIQLLTDSLFSDKPISCKYYDTGIEIRTPYN